MLLLTSAKEHRLWRSGQLPRNSHTRPLRELTSFWETSVTYSFQLRSQRNSPGNNSKLREKIAGLGFFRATRLCNTQTQQTLHFLWPNHQKIFQNLDVPEFTSATTQVQVKSISEWLHPPHPTSLLLVFHKGNTSEAAPVQNWPWGRQLFHD